MKGRQRKGYISQSDSIDQIEFGAASDRSDPLHWQAELQQKYWARLHLPRLEHSVWSNLATGPGHNWFKNLAPLFTDRYKYFTNFILFQVSICLVSIVIQQFLPHLEGEVVHKLSSREKGDTEQGVSTGAKLNLNLNAFEFNWRRQKMLDAWVKS